MTLSHPWDLPHRTGERKERATCAYFWTLVTIDLSKRNTNETRYLVELPGMVQFYNAVHLTHCCSQVEREANQGSLGSIDALLGCPLYLPKHEVCVLICICNYSLH